MSTQPQRRRLELGVYERLGADGQRVGLEITFRDAQNTQRRRVVDGGPKAGIMAARAQLAREVAKRVSGERVAADTRLKFDRAADEWVDAHVRRLRPNSQATHEFNLRHLRGRFGSWRLIDITPGELVKYVAAMEATHSGRTVADHLGVMRQVFDHAGRHLGFVGVNPVDQLTRSERPSTRTKKPIYVLGADELPRLLDALEDEYRLLFDLAAQTGARVNEALGFAWGDVDLERGTIAFTHQLDRQRRRVPLKTEASKATLPLGKSMVAKLSVHKLASTRTGPENLIFVNARGEAWDDFNISCRVMPRAAKHAKIVVPEDHRISFHALRHAFGSRLIADGADIAEVQRLMRHESAATTLKVYTHEFDASRRDQERRDRLERLYGDGSGMAAPDGTERHQESTPSEPKVAYLHGRRTA